LLRLALTPAALPPSTLVTFHHISDSSQFFFVFYLGMAEFLSVGFFFLLFDGDPPPQSSLRYAENHWPLPPLGLFLFTMVFSGLVVGNLSSFLHTGYYPISSPLCSEKGYFFY